MRLAAIPASFIVLATACQDQSGATGPMATAATPGLQAHSGAIPIVGFVELGTEAWAATEAAANASPTHGLALTCFAGPCSGAAGTVNFSAPARSVDGAAPGFGVAHEGVYTVHGAPPNTVYLLQRAIDINVNGVCTGTFITWPFPPTQPLGDPSGPPAARLTTSPSGAGAAHFTFEFAGGNPALRVDIIFRLIEESPNPGGTELRTACGPN
jgi:hypothetical protein